MTNRTSESFLADMPFDAFRAVQESVIDLCLDTTEGGIYEVPTGEGKTPIGMVICLNAVSQGRTAFYVVPTKYLVDQVCLAFPNHTRAVYGRGEYECLYYKGKPNHPLPVSAAESPCYMLKCPHRVDQQTGETEDPEAVPCPYYHAKYGGLKGADLGKVIVCTISFFLLNRLLVKGWDMENTCVVFDEGHNLASDARGIFEYTINDYHLERAKEAISPFCPDQARILRKFVVLFRRAMRAKQSRASNLLSSDESKMLIGILDEFKPDEVETAVRSAIESDNLNGVDDRDTIKTLENAVRNIPRFLRSLKYSLPEGDRNPLNYVVASWLKEGDPELASGRRKARYFLTVRSYYVAPLIRKAAGKDVTVLSATIGNSGIFKNETGLGMEFTAFPSTFSADNARIYMPRDTPNLSTKKARRDDPRKAQKQMADSAKRFVKAKKRCLMVVVSEAERTALAIRCRKEGINALTYGEGKTARETAQAFRSGTGDVLIGTFAQYGEGIDLPAGIAPVIMVLRPGYQRPDDPMTQFEERRFPQSHCWRLWQYRVILQALQVRGRNIRSAEDVGITIFFSQQFTSFLHGSLPAWLQPSYVGKKLLSECVDDALELLA